MIPSISGKLQSFIMASVIALNGDGLYFDEQLDPDSLKPLAVFGMRADYVYLSKHSVHYYLSGPRSIFLSELTGGNTSSGRRRGFGCLRSRHLLNVSIYAW